MVQIKKILNLKQGHFGIANFTPKEEIDRDRFITAVGIAKPPGGKF